MFSFKTPVVVEPGVLGRFRIVASPRDAVEVLTGRWPDKAGHQYEKALQACREAAEGRLKPHLARRSFVAAARTAQVLIPPEVSRRYTVGSVDLATVPLKPLRESSARSSFSQSSY